MPSQSGVEHLPDLRARLKSRKILPAELSLPRSPSRFGKMQGTRRARTELAYLDMMRTVSHGENDSFDELTVRLKSTEDLAAATPSAPKTPSLPKRVIHQVKSAPASATPSPPKTPSRFERNSSCRSTTCCSATSPRLDEDRSSFSTSPRHTLSPPPAPAGREHRDSAAFLARMHEAESNKHVLGRWGVGPSLLEGVLDSWESVRPGEGGKGGKDGGARGGSPRESAPLSAPVLKRGGNSAQAAAASLKKRVASTMKAFSFFKNVQ